MDRLEGQRDRGVEVRAVAICKAPRLIGHCRDSLVFVRIRMASSSSSQLRICEAFGFVFSVRWKCFSFRNWKCTVWTWQFVCALKKLPRNLATYVQRSKWKREVVGVVLALRQCEVTKIRLWSWLHRRKARSALTPCVGRWDRSLRVFLYFLRACITTCTSMVHKNIIESKEMTWMADLVGEERILDDQCQS